MPRILIIFPGESLHIAAWKPDTSPGGSGSFPMKNLFFAALAALSLTAAVAPAANALTYSAHSGPYDNTGNGPKYNWGGGGGG
jgi:hypothetical protein